MFVPVCERNMHIERCATLNKTPKNSKTFFMSASRILIVDNESLIRQDLTSLILQTGIFEHVDACGSVSEARTALKETKPDVLLLDIELGDGTGFDLLHQLPCRDFQLVFMTAYNQFAIRAIKCGALDYLLKPVDEDELHETLNKALSRQKKISRQNQASKEEFDHLRYNGMQDRIALRSQYYWQIVHFDEIVYCKNEGNYTTFHLTDGKEVTVSKSIKEYESLLPKKSFLRTHQSYLVNLRFVRRVHKEGYLVLNNETEVPMSSRKKDQVMSIFMGYDNY